MPEKSQIQIVPCGPADLAELREVGLQSFTEAFAAQNKPSDFEAYVSVHSTRIRSNGSCASGLPSSIFQKPVARQRAI
jgi:hypothetical protein